MFEVLNGNGIGNAGNRVYDDDKYKTFFGRVMQAAADNIRIGGFGYWGKEGQGNPNEVAMARRDASLSYQDRLELNVQYLWRKDTNPAFMASQPSEVVTQGAVSAN